MVTYGTHKTVTAGFWQYSTVGRVDTILKSILDFRCRAACPEAGLTHDTVHTEINFIVK